MFRIGEKVQVRSGPAGYVADVRSFSDSSAGMPDDEFVVFVGKCKQIYGDKYYNEYQRVLVEHGKTLRWYDKADLELIEGRGG
jgi:hypothetical protein